MGMDKNGQQTGISTSVYTKLTAFVARSGYGSTVITNSTLVMDATGTGTLRYNVIFNASFTGQMMQIVKNGTTIVDGPVAANAIRTSGTISVNTGDTLEIQALANNTGAFATVNSGNTTFLEYNQLTSTQPVSGSTTDTWARSGTLALNAVVGATTTESWGRSGSLSVTAHADGTRTNNWGITGGIYKGAFLDVDTDRPVNWGVSGNILLVPKVSAPPSAFSFADVAVSVHTADGRSIGDFTCDTIASYKWGREDSEVSTAEIGVMTQGNPDLCEELRQWVHWITVWHDDIAVWTGPIQGITLSRATTTISARDSSTFMYRTRVPITRTFTDTAPARIADTVWQAMNRLHGIRATPFVIPGVVNDTFTVAAVSDTKMLNSFMDDLVKVGLHWTVVAGRPILGVFPADPVAELAQCDFMVELQRRRDGTQTFNDVRVQGTNFSATATAPLGGLHLQTIVSMDDLSGAANIQRAALNQANKLAVLRDELVVPASASLHPQAPITLDDLMPGKAFIVHSDTISQVMRLDQVDVSGGSDSFDIQVTLVALTSTGSATLTGGATV